MSRPYYFSPLQFHNLDRACVTINSALQEYGYGCYLVGSSTERRDFRDVDVRYIMRDVDFDKLFGGRDEFWSFLSVVTSAYLSKETGLHIDFQIQKQSHANTSHAKKRNALGHVCKYPGEWPSSLEPPVPPVRNCSCLVADRADPACVSCGGTGITPATLSAPRPWPQRCQHTKGYAEAGHRCPCDHDCPCRELTCRQ